MKDLSIVERGVLVTTREEAAIGAGATTI